ncbi:trypsin-like peptidase domain-containing protein, partial [Patescibacteria group bacterium]|nr:trypsin-like peptidase domain-containing protein [Patescibacteria group bacterium]
MKTTRRFRGLKFFLKVFLISLFSGIVILGLVVGAVWLMRARIVAYIASYAPQSTLVDIPETPVVPIAGGEVVTEVVVTPPQDVTTVEVPLSVTEVVAKTNASVVSVTLSKGGVSVGKGTGFFVSKDGLIVTNRHVVNTDGATITVTTTDGKERSATLVATDPVLDIAILRVQGNTFVPLVLGDSSALSSGQSVVAIGYALGTFQNSVSAGVISGLSRSIIASGSNGESEYLDQVIQTDAAINRGNSGGPLLNLKGEVIGVNVATATTSQSIGFALPINDVKQAVTSVQKTGRIIRPYIGVRYTQITTEVAQSKSLPVTYGVLVGSGKNAEDVAVLPGSPAERAGIVSGDILLT